MNVTLSDAAIADLTQLIFINVTEQLAEEIKKWQVPDTYSPQEKEATRRVLANISMRYQQSALEVRKKLPANSHAHTLMNMVKRNLSTLNEDD